MRTTTVKLAPGTSDRITGWLNNEVILRSVRHMVIHGQPEHARGTNKPLPQLSLQQIYASLEKLLPVLKVLKEFTFASPVPFPLAILDALHKYQPNVRLHINNWTRLSPSTPFGDPTELALAQSPILRSLHAEIHDDSSFDLRYPAFTRIVSLAPNLELFHFRRKYSRMLLSPVDQYKHLRQTEPFVVKPSVRSALKSIHIETATPSSTYLLESLPSVHWSALHTLTGVTLHEDFPKAPLHGAVFSSLKSLSIRLAIDRIVEPISAFTDFFCSLNPLECLRIVDGRKYLSLPLILGRHGYSLRIFHIHEIEQPESQRITFTNNELTAIRDSCPFLQDFGLDVNRTEGREVYQLISTFPTLRHLTINFELGLHLLDTDMASEEQQKTRDVLYPELSDASVKELWLDTGGDKLESLTIHVGEQDRPIFGWAPPRWMFEETYLRRKFIVTKHERDDMKGQVVIDSFPKLNPRLFVPCSLDLS